MKILITGATGFLGTHLSRECVSNGHSVRAFVRPTSQTSVLEKMGVECISASLYNPDDMSPYLSDIEAVVHCAGGGKVIHQSDFYRFNVDTADALLRALKQAKAPLRRFVLLSSLAAHGPARNGLPQTEDMIERPVTHYGRSKLMAERIALKYRHNFPISILRPPAIYGPGDTRFLMMYRQIKKGAFPIPPGRSELSMVYSQDCVSAIMACLTQNHTSGECYFIAEKNTYSTQQLVMIIAQSLNIKVKFLPVPISVLSSIAKGAELLSKINQTPAFLTTDKVRDMSQGLWICNASKIREQLGWNPRVTLKDGIEFTTESYQELGWL